MSPPLLSIDGIKRHLGIDAAEIARRREFFGIDDSIATLVGELHALFGDASGELTGDFYEHLIAQPELQALIGDPATLERLRRSLQRYFQSLTAGAYGDAYVDERLRVGLVHYRVGLAPKWYIGAYRHYLSCLLPVLWSRSSGDEQCFGRTLDALLRLTFFDMSLALETYHGAHLHELAEAGATLRAAHAEATELAHTYSAIVNAIQANLALVDETGTILAVNEGWRRFADSNDNADASYGVGRDYFAICAAAQGEGAADAAKVAAGLQAILRRETSYYAHEYTCHAAQERRWFRAILTPVEFRGRPGAVVMHVNISDRKERELALWRSANYDMLTNIPNRVLTLDRLGQAVSMAGRTNSLVALLFIDFDRFKLVNDLLGHAAGDEVLRVIAGRLQGELREQDTVGRISGDEFLVILPNLRRPDEALTVARKLLEATARPIDYNGQETFLTCSIGIAMAPLDSDDPEELVRYADAAMYRAKQMGRNRVQFFTGEVQVGSTGRLQFEADLRRALERREFEVHYQPKADIAGGRINGAEALLRWRHPQRGLVVPGDFIPLLEEIGLIHEVGLWVIEQVCADIFDWQQDGLQPGRIAINVSPLQLQEENFVREVANLLAGTDIPANALEFEITESYLLHNPESAAARLRELNALGIEFAIDDFGTGYSNLGYLRRLPIHTIKIDRSFVQDIPGNADNTLLAGAVILMARHLNLNVVAEGIEDENQLDFLAGCGCDTLQGYLYARPLPLPAFRAFVAGDGVLVPSRSGMANGAAPRVVVADVAPATLTQLQELVAIEGHPVVAALRPEDALRRMAEGPVAAVIVAHRPPGLDGLALLEQMRHLYPQARRILIADAPGDELLLCAINRCTVHKVLSCTAAAASFVRELRDALRGAAAHAGSDVR